MEVGHPPILLTPEIYWASFALSVIGSIVLVTIDSKAPQGHQMTELDKIQIKNELHVQSTTSFVSFQQTYLAAYLCAMLGDWLQGPYIYELYVSYGFLEAQIAELFVCGFLSSMIAGTIVGSLADKYGRRLMCRVYALLYIAACFTKIANNYWCLMLGRFLSGVSTSLLFSVFESWMVSEHHQRGFSEEQLAHTFAIATFGNGFMGVVGGLAANTVANTYGFVAPFVLAIIPLSLVLVLVSKTWNENTGFNPHEDSPRNELKSSASSGSFSSSSSSSSSSLLSSFNAAVAFLWSEPKIAALGLSQSLFEGAMYTFVFMWTPALQEKTASYPTIRLLALATRQANQDSMYEASDVTPEYLGLIFAVFMLCSIMGSSLFKIVSTQRGESTVVPMLPLFLHSVSGVAFWVVSEFYNNKIMVYLAFLIYEICIGAFYPTYGFLKSGLIKEEVRSSVMNIFRIPLNAFVVVLLCKIDMLTHVTIFKVCAGANFLGLLLYCYFYVWYYRVEGRYQEKISKSSMSAKEVKEVGRNGRKEVIAVS